MNMQAQIQDFGYQDFILVQSPPASVLSALRVVLDHRESGAPLAHPERPKGLMRRALNILRRSKHEPGEIPEEVEQTGPVSTLLDGDRDQDKPEVPAFQVYRGQAAELAGQILTSEISISPDQDKVVSLRPRFTDDIRVSTPRAAEDWCLVEFRETLGETCPLAQELSTQMAGAEILYFRRSGDVATDVHFDFHVYCNGQATRRVACHSTWPETDETFDEVWTGVTEGTPTRYEGESFDPKASEMDLLDEVKQEMILAYLGLSYDALFRPEAKNDPVLITRRDGGEPLATL